jgi:Flp pilus assembly protein TadD
MSAVATPHRNKIRPWAAVSVLLLAAVIWAIALVWQSKRAGVRKHLLAGAEYVRLGNSKGAETEWLQASRLEPKNPQVWELLGELYMSTERWMSALEAFRKLEKIKPETPNLYTRLAVSAIRTGDENGSYIYAQSQLQRDPNDIASLLISAHILRLRGEELKRLDYLRRLHQLLPQDKEILSFLTEALTSKYKYDEARLLLTRQIELDPNDAQAYSLRGLGYLNSDPSPQGLENAEKDFLAALKINPLAPFPRLHLGKVYRMRGNLKEALLQMEQAMRVLPDKMDIYYEIAPVYAQAKMPEKAAAARKKYNELRHALDYEASLGKRCVADPNNYAIHLEMGQLQLKKGDARQASYYLSRAQAIRPHDPPLQQALRQLGQLVGAVDQNASLMEKATTAAKSNSPKATGQPTP